MQIGVGVEPSSRLRSPGQRPELWRRDIWFIAAASLICVAVVMAEPAWQLFSVAALFFAVVIAITRNDSRLWLFLTGVLSAFNFAKLVGGEPPVRSGDPIPFAIFALDIPIVVLLGTALFQRAVRRRSELSISTAARSAIVLGLAFCAWAGIGAILCDRPTVAVFETIRYLRLVIALGVIAFWSRERSSLLWGLAGLFVALTAQSSIAAVQFALESSLDLHDTRTADTVTGMVVRAGGTLNPTVLSEYIAIVAPLLLATAFASKRRWVATLLFALFALAATATTMTLSRAGIVNIALTATFIIAAYTFRKDIPGFRKAMLVSGMLGVAISIAVWLSEAVIARIAEIHVEVELEGARLAQMGQAVRMIGANPVTGVGLGNYVEAMWQYGPTLPYPVHNKFLLVAAETGLPGLALYLALWFFVLKRFVGETARRASLERAFFLSGAAAVFAALLNMNTDIYSLGGAPEMTLFLVAGLGLGLNRDADQASTPRPPVAV